MSAVLVIVPPAPHPDWVQVVAHQAVVRLRRAGHVVGILPASPTGKPGRALRSALHAVDGLVIAAPDPPAAALLRAVLDTLPTGSLRCAAALSIVGAGRRNERPAEELTTLLRSLGAGHVMPAVRVGPPYRQTGRDRLVTSLTALADICAVGTWTADLTVDET